MWLTDNLWREASITIAEHKNHDCYKKQITASLESWAFADWEQMLQGGKSFDVTDQATETWKEFGGDGNVEELL